MDYTYYHFIIYTACQATTRSDE